MSGIGNRFKKAGYTSPKYLLDISGRPVIHHVLDLFSKHDEIHLILNENDFNNSNIIDQINTFHNNENINFHSIPSHKKGPGFALLKSQLLDTKDEVYVNYCDFSNIWDWNDVKAYIKKNKPDGLLPAYKGLHLHSLYGNNYAFINEKNGNVLGIKEKEPFTDSPAQEFASTGGYYFSSGKLAQHYINRLFEENILVNDEAYISSAYDLMVSDGLAVKIFEIDHFFQWGTPEDYEEFIYCMNEIENIKTEKKINLKDINLVLPVAGKGGRFVDAGYEVPKIFLDVNGYSLVQQVLKKFENQISTKLLTSSTNFEDLNKNFIKTKNIEIYSTKTQTRGQAESALELIKKIDNNKPIFVQSGDAVLQNVNIANVMQKNPDMVVLTKKNYRRAFQNPENYGWVFSKNNIIEDSLIKSIPRNSNYSMILGSFIFKDKKVYEKLFDKISQKIQGELHIDFMIKEALDMGLDVVELEASKTSVLGIPLEYELFKYSLKIFEWIQLL